MADEMLDQMAEEPYDSEMGIDDGMEVEETPDGGFILSLGEEEEPAQETGFFDNILPEFEAGEMAMLATNLLEDIDRDKRSRELRDKQYAEAIRKTGLGDEQAPGADFSGSSTVVHPLVTESCIDFSSRAIKELMPSNGPARISIPDGEANKGRFDKAERKKNYLNWQCLTQMPELRTEIEQLLTQLALAGSQYLRLVYDSRKQRPVPVFVSADDLWLPYSASSLYTAERVTYVEHITSQEFELRVDAGMYTVEQGDLVDTGQVPEGSEAQQATEAVSGTEPDGGSNEDGLRDLFEVTTMVDLEEDVGLAPYRIVLDNELQKIIGIYRNWEEEDELRESLFWCVEFPFIPWRGAYTLGLGQIIGSLAGAATGALRALLDSGHVNNLPTVMKLKGSNLSGQTHELNVAAVTELEGGTATDDIRKLMMPVPFNPPSPVLFQLLGFLVDAGRGVVRTSFDHLSEQRPDMPVGTTLALIEEGMKIQSSIHLRLFHSMTRFLEVLSRINRMHMKDEETVKKTGSVLAKREDFQSPLDVIPVADPNIFSDVQRLAQLQVIADRAKVMPQIYNLRKVEERILERTKIPNPEELLMPAPEPTQQNAVNENAALTLSRPVVAFPEQDHLAHIQVHLDFLVSPVLGQNPIIAPTFIPGVLTHLKEHISLWYVTAHHDLLKEALEQTDEELSTLMGHHDPETRIELDRALAASSPGISKMSSDTLSRIPQVVQQAMQMMQQLTPQGPQIPIDPNKQATIQQKEASDARRDATEKELAQLRISAEQGKLQQAKELKFMELSADQQQSQLDAAIQEAQQSSEWAARLQELQQRELAEAARTDAEIASRERMNAQDNETALTIAAAEIESGERVGLETGTGIDPNP